MQSNEILDMRNSMKINFVNHQKASKQPIPHTLDLHSQIKQHKIKDPPPFSFKIKDKTLDWQQASQFEISDNNIDQASSVIKNLSFAYVTPDDVEMFGSQRCVNTFKLMQLSIEYLNHSQNHIEDLLRDFEAEHHVIQKALNKTTKRCEANK